MASYAAVVSLLNLLVDVQQHSRRWILLHEHHIQSLHQRATAFLKFIEDNNDYSSSRLHKSDNGSDLATQMADSSFAAENIIRSFVSAQILLQFEDTLPTNMSHCISAKEEKRIKSLVTGRPQLVSQCKETVSSFSEQIQKAIQEMDVIQEKVEEKLGEDPKTRNPQPSIAARFISPISKSTMVGLDDALLEIMDRLTGQGSKLQTIPIVGMGGIGKTTLALNVFQNRHVVEHFDICSWITISQQYSFRDILSTLLKSVTKSDIDSKWSDEQLGEKIYKTLFGRRYFIVMDDVWDIEAWNRVKTFFPENGKGSRVLMTTRMSAIADYFKTTPPYRMSLLDEGKSWEIFHDKVFSGGVVCSDELEVLGRKIVKCCGGLTLAITVIGGLLAKSDMKLEYWEHVAENLNSVLSLEGDDCCHKVLYLSYSYLPIKLKPCFLHMSCFQEDERVYVRRLIKLWVAEGFLKPVDDKSLEDVGLEYLNNLIDRNLILVQKRSNTGKVTYCGMHDLVRDLSLRESRRENFRSTNRIPCHDAMISRYISHNVRESKAVAADWCSVREHVPFMDMISKCSDDELIQLFNLRYFSYLYPPRPLEASLFVIPLFWTLQTFIFSLHNVLSLPVQFWRMTQLRHVYIEDFMELPEESQFDEMNSSLVNLQTLCSVLNFRCSQQILKMFPNVKDLKLWYKFDGLDWSRYCLKNLVHLSKLESLRIWTLCSRIPIGMISFPHSLTELDLWDIGLYWQDMSVIGSMPNLEVLILRIGAIQGSVWTVNAGEFTRLKYLRLEKLLDLKYWRADSSNFRCLKRLDVWGISLEEYPWDFGEIPTLQHISLRDCSYSAKSWAEQIQKRREELHDEYVHVEWKIFT